MCAAATAQKPKEKTAQASNKKSDNPKPAHTQDKSVVQILNDLRITHTTRERKYRAGLREDICTAYDLGMALRTGRHQWSLFVKGDWTGITGPPEIHQNDQAVRFALKFMVGPGDSAQKDANFYHRAIAPFVERQVSVGKLRKILDKTPLKTLVDKHAKEKKDARSAAKPVTGQKATRAPDSKGADVKSEKVVVPAPKTTDGSITAECMIVFSHKAWKNLAVAKVGQKIALKGKLDELGKPISMSVTSVKSRPDEKAD